MTVFLKEVISRIFFIVHLSQESVLYTVAMNKYVGIHFYAYGT